MRGYRIPAKDVQANNNLQTLQDLVAIPPGGTSVSNRRGLENVSFYTSWMAYNRKGEPPKYSADIQKQPEEAKRFVKATESLWEEASDYLKMVCPGQFKVLACAKLPQGMERLAGVWTGFAVNGGSEAVPVETEPHRDHKSVFYGKSCLYPFGNFIGGAVIIWELRAVLELRAGELFIFEDHLLTHSNEEAIGERHSLVAFEHQSVLDWHNAQFDKRDIRTIERKARQVEYRAEGRKRQKEFEKRRTKAKRREANARQEAKVARTKTVSSRSVRSK
jgi:hypothetical protein